LPKEALQIVALGLLNALISVTFLFFEKCYEFGFLVAGHIYLAVLAVIVIFLAICNKCELYKVLVYGKV